MFRPNIIGVDTNRNVSNKKLKLASILAGTQRPACALSGGRGWWVPSSLIGSQIARGILGCVQEQQEKQVLSDVLQRRNRKTKPFCWLYFVQPLRPRFSPPRLPSTQEQGLAGNSCKSFFYDYIVQLLRWSFFCRTNIISDPCSLKHWSTCFVSSVVTYWLGLHAFFWLQWTFELFQSVLWTHLQMCSPCSSRRSALPMKSPPIY